MSWDMALAGAQYGPTHLLTAFSGRLLAALSVAGVAAHWINTAGEIKQVISIIHRQTVPPHYLAKISDKREKTNAVSQETKAALAERTKTSCVNKGQTVWRNLRRQGAAEPMSPVEDNLIRAEGGGGFTEDQTEHSSAIGRVCVCACA